MRVLAPNLILRVGGFAASLVLVGCGDPVAEAERKRAAEEALMVAGLRFSHVGIEVDGRRLVLTGKVANAEDRAAAMDLLGGLEGAPRVDGEGLMTEPRRPSWVLWIEHGEEKLLAGELPDPAARGPMMAGRDNEIFDDRAYVNLASEPMTMPPDSEPEPGQPRVFLGAPGDPWQAVPLDSGGSLGAAVEAALPEEATIDESLRRRLAELGILGRLPRPRLALVVVDGEVRLRGGVREESTREAAVAAIESAFPGLEKSVEITVDNTWRPQSGLGKSAMVPPLPRKGFAALVAGAEVGSPWQVIVSGRERITDPQAGIEPFLPGGLAGAEGTDPAAFLASYESAHAIWQGEQKKPWPWLALASYGGATEIFGQVATAEEQKLVMARAAEIMDGFALVNKIEVTDRVRQAPDPAPSLRSLPRPPRQGGAGTLAAVWLGEVWERGHPADPQSLQGHFPRGFGWKELSGSLDRLRARAKVAAQDPNTPVVLPAEGVDPAEMIDPWIGLRFEGTTLHLTGEVATNETAEKIRAKLGESYPEHEIEGEIVVTALATKARDYFLTLAIAPDPPAADQSATTFARLGFSWCPSALYTIYYGANDEAPKPQQARAVARIRGALRRDPEATIELVGHTDSRGEVRENLRVSLRRAQRFAEALIEAGIDEEKLSYRGAGEMVPAGDNTSEEGRAMNRRVEILLKSGGE